MAKVFQLCTASSKALLTPKVGASAQKAAFATYPNPTSKRKWLWAAVGAATTAGVGVLYALEQSVHAGALELHPPKLPWSHNGYLSTLDMASVRRGYFVYKQVCAACHSLNQIYYRHFVDVFMTEEEAKAEAAEQTIDEINPETGKMMTRPRKLFDKLPNPYANKILAKLANNNAAPPDMSWINLARHGGENYIFMLLTGYQDPPAGIELGEGQAYNPYFAGGVLSMAQQLFDEMLEYPDGTPATQSQMAKDVSTFLKWCSEPEFDQRKKLTLNMLVLTPFVVGLLLYYKRYIFTTTKSERLLFRTLKGRERPPS